MMKKILLVLAITAALLSCSGEEKDGSTLNIAVSQDVATLDVMKSTSRVLRDILVGHVYEKLFVLSDGNLIGELATGYELSGDGKTLRIDLRDDAVMHDGSAMTERDVASSLNRYIECYDAALSMVGDARFSAGDGYVSISAENTLYLFPYLLASSPQSAVITKESALEENEYGLITEIIGTGPYVLESFVPGSEVTLSRFDGYVPYGEERKGLGGIKHAYADKIVFNVVAEPAIRTLGLQKGDYDFINDVMSYDIPALSSDEDIALIGGEESGSIALVFNKKSRLGSDVHFRRAVAYASDYDSLMKACYGDSGYSIHSDYMEKEQELFSVEGDPYLEQDLALAAEELEKSGYDGQAFRILTSNLSNLDRIAVALVSDLNEVGIKTEITVTDWVGFLSERNNEESYDLFISAFSSVPLPDMKLYFGENYPGWYESEEKDEILSRLRSAESIDEASAIWQEAQHYFWSEVPVIISGHYSTINASRSDITGIIAEDGNHFYNARRIEE